MLDVDYITKPKDDDIFENLVYNKYQQINKVFNSYHHKLTTRSMRHHIIMVLVTIYLYLRSDDLLAIGMYAEDFAKLSDDDKELQGLTNGLKGPLREAVVTAVFSLFEEFPLTKQSTHLSFVIDCEPINPEEDEFHFQEPLKDAFIFKINIHSKAKKDKAVGVTYTKPYGLDSDEFFIPENLKDFALFLFLLTTSNAFSRRIISFKDIKNSTSYLRREEVLFGDLNKPLE